VRSEVFDGRSAIIENDRPSLILGFFFSLEKYHFSRVNALFTLLITHDVWELLYCKPADSPRLSLLLHAVVVGEPCLAKTDEPIEMPFGV